MNFYPRTQRMAGKIFFLLLASLSFSPVLSAQKDFSAQGTFVPPEGKVLLLIGQDKQSIASYLKQVGIDPAGFMVYTSIEKLDGLVSPSLDRGAGVHDAQFFTKKYPHAVLQIGLYLVDALDGIIAGQYDGNIERLSAMLKEMRRPVYLRIGYEFDLPENHYDPEKYRQAFRYIVDKLREAGVRNVAYVWHSCSFFNPEKPLMSWYPGDDYVDWFGISFFDCYNWANMKLLAKLARQHGKPLMIAEAAPAKMPTTSGERTWNIWFKKFFQFIAEEQVKVFCYINNDWDQFPMFKSVAWGDSRIEANDFVRQQWRGEIQKEKYLQSTPDLFRKLSFR